MTPGFAVLLGVAVCLDPGGLFLPFAAATLAHELGHLIAMGACHVPPSSVRLGLAGVTIFAAFPGPRQELICAAAGPLANLLSSTILLPAAPKFAAAGILLAAFNLLPVYPLDGGRIVRAVAPRAAETVSVVTAAVLLLAGAVLTAVFHLGLWPLILLFLLLGRIALCRLEEERSFPRK